MNNLENKQDIVYMWENKGSSFTKMTMEQYLMAGEKDLENDCYINVPADPSIDVKAENDRLVSRMLNDGEISEKVANIVATRVSLYTK